MNTYNIYQKYQSVHMARHNKPMKELKYLCSIEEESMVKAIKKASQQTQIHAILLTATKETYYGYGEQGPRYSHENGKFVDNFPCEG